MVAAGATILMTANEENSSTEAENVTTSSVNQNTYPRCREIQHCSQRNNDMSHKGNVATCSSNISKYERK
jgi:hypothetical protein